MGDRPLYDTRPYTDLNHLGITVVHRRGSASYWPWTLREGAAFRGDFTTRGEAVTAAQRLAWRRGGAS